ncbi:hypothetical protein EJ08DRAFT_676060 [Tothia fuscella]|uniref:BTB domain-containing protein n=1 Tax=Tothia fuscella TaxID=1048955 RepID=A0A9P4NZP2_9PEZI|nr:hypothetical protein EJ08DRAFT_676060 [Tothia fuscella]
MSNNESNAVQELTASLSKLYESGLYSDLTISCGDDTYKAHKAIVCPRSEFFSRACREGRWKEGEEGHVVLYRDDPDTARADADLVKWMMHYLYHLDYLEMDLTERPTDVREPAPKLSWGRPPQMPPTFSGPAFPGPPTLQYPGSQDPGPSDRPEHNPRESVDPARNPLVHSRMYAIADFYEIPGLKQLAQKKFQQAASRHWNSPEFVEAIHVAYTSTVSNDKGLRQICKDVLLQHMMLLNKPEIEGILREVPDLAFDMLKGLWLRDGARNDYLPPPSPTQPLSEVWRTLR